MANFTEIDGSLLEGGGQVLRNSMALSALLRKPIHIVNIRAGRSKPGLRAQHLKGIELVARMYQGALTGANLNSVEVTFEPDSFYPEEKFEVDIQTAGSICLLIQTSLPPLLYSGHPNIVIMKGGTNAAAAPQIDYFLNVFKPIVSKHFGLQINADVIRRGYFPKGGGIVALTTQPLINPIPAIQMMDRGHVKKIWIRSFVAGLHKNINGRIIESALKPLKNYLRHSENHTYREIEWQIDEVEEDNFLGRGTGVIIIAETSTGCLLAGSALGEKRMPAEQIGEEAVESLISDLRAGGCVDQYLQDQLIIWMALAGGVSSVLTGELTLHTRTAIHFAELMSKAKFVVVDRGNGTFIITCQGINLSPSK